MMHRDGWSGPKATSAVPFAWFVWERGHQGPITTYRITAKNRNGRTGSRPPNKEKCHMTTPSKPHAVSDAPPDQIEIATTRATPPDPFDLNALRLDQSFVETAGVKKLLTTVPVRKPNPQDFVRVHPDPEYRATLAVIELKEDREIYLVTPPIARELPGEFVMVMLFTTINRQGVVRLWPVRLPAPDGRVLEWHRSAADAAEMAMRRWVRVKANMCARRLRDLRGHRRSQNRNGRGDVPGIVRIAFRDRLVDRLDHPGHQAAAR